MREYLRRARRDAGPHLPMAGFAAACAIGLPGVAAAGLAWQVGAGWPWILGLYLALPALGLTGLAGLCAALDAARARPVSAVRVAVPATRVALPAVRIAPNG